MSTKSMLPVLLLVGAGGVALYYFYEKKAQADAAAAASTSTTDPNASSTTAGSSVPYGAPQFMPQSSSSQSDGSESDGSQYDGSQYGGPQYGAPQNMRRFARRHPTQFLRYEQHPGSYARSRGYAVPGSSRSPSYQQPSNVSPDYSDYSTLDNTYGNTSYA
jgi:hypothetical protein